MVSLETFIEQTNAASSAEEVFRLFEEALREFGYDRICYSLITDHPSLGLHAGHGVLRNYSEDWMKHYFERGYEKVDPVPKFCFSTNMPFTWDWLTATQTLSDNARLVMTEANEAKLHDGVAVPLYGANGELAGVGMASSSGGVEIDKNMLCVIRALAFQFHLAFTEKEAEQNALKNIHLTDREKEILLWAAEGKSDPVIADILSISYPTVRYHMNNIFRKLGANERTFAVVKAIRHGLILPSYVSDLNDPYQTR
jgi:DNA-binding CsgD family transcriptional regulator